MLGAGPVSEEGGHMPPGDIPLVLGETVRRVARIQLGHHAVPADLGYHGSRRNGRGDLVALPHGQRWQAKPPHREAVSEHVPRAAPEPCERPAHPRNVTRVQPERVDLAGRYGQDMPVHRMACDVLIQALARIGRQRLGVREPWQRAGGGAVQGDSRYDKRPGARSAPGLVDPGNR